MRVWEKKYTSTGPIGGATCRTEIKGRDPGDDLREKMGTDVRGGGGVAGGKNKGRLRSSRARVRGVRASKVPEDVLERVGPGHCERILVLGVGVKVGRVAVVLDGRDVRRGQLPLGRLLPVNVGEPTDNAEKRGCSG